ncbi:MAG: hypothetical protein ABIQ40_04750 [Bacteroidia bacterium]
MIRYVFILASIILLSSAKCSNAKTTETATTVYITATGKKYHMENCRSLNESKSAVTLSDAIAQGYGPCKVCHPPTLNTAK